MFLGFEFQLRGISRVGIFLLLYNQIQEFSLSFSQILVLTSLVDVFCWGQSAALPHGRLLTYHAECDLNVIKDFGFPHWTPIGFQMRWSKTQANKWYQSQGHGFKSQEHHVGGGIVGINNAALPT